MRRILLVAAAALPLLVLAVTTGLGTTTSQAAAPKKAAAIAEAKMAAAMAYSGQVDGKPAKNLESLEKWTRALTGESRKDVRPSSPEFALPKDGKAQPLSNQKRAELQTRYLPFEQVTDYYCGPATVMSMLHFLGATEAKIKNHDGGIDRLNGDPVHDQRLLAGDFWLATEKYNGTMWGEGYVPFALNGFLGTDWYVLEGTPNVGGDLTKDKALAAIRYDTDRGYPVAENVLYSPETYYPAGFWPGITYMHWDTVFGHYKEGNGRQMVQIGQVYHSPTLPFERYQSIPWDVHWDAIGKWYGIVW